MHPSDIVLELQQLRLIVCLQIFQQRMSIYKNSLGIKSTLFALILKVS